MKSETPWILASIGSLVLLIATVGFIVTHELPRKGSAGGTATIINGTGTAIGGRGGDDTQWMVGTNGVACFKTKDGGVIVSWNYAQ